MADFREEIDRLQTEHTKEGLIDALEERLGERPTSVNPLTVAMFAELRPGTEPVEYARRDEDFTADKSRVATRAIGLKVLLHEQIGRPLSQPVDRLVKQDLAECIAAIDAFRDGYEQGMDLHVPTTLPLDETGFVDEPPDRSGTPPSPFGVEVDLETESELQQLEAPFTTSDSPYYVYVFDCTPPVEDESQKSRDRRRAVQTRIDAGVSISELESNERGSHALNQGKRVYYVGSTNDGPKRVREHLSGTDKSGVNFTNTLPPRSLVKVRGCDSRAHAESLEGALARKLSEREGLFAYSDAL